MGNGNLKEVKQVPFKTCMAIFSVDNEKMLIADNDNKTLYQLNGDDLQKIAIFKIDSKTGISEEINPYIVSFFVDRDGILWICTDGHGIFSHNPNTILCKKNNVGFTRCIEEHNGKIIIGTFKNGLWETNPDLTNKRLINQNAIPASSDIFSIYSQNNQRLWVLTDTELVVLDNDYNLVFCERNKHQSGILHGCDDGKILVSQSGIARFYETSDFTYKRTFTPFKPITSIIRIKGEMIYGTSSELLTFNPKLFNRDTIYTHDLQILEKYPVKSMFLKDTALWTATNDGIWIWTFNVDKSTLEKKEHFLDNESIYSLLEDNYNRIWFSSNTGIGFLNTAEGTSHFLGPQHNLQSLEFNSYAALKSSRGWHYYGGINGVNAINPDAVKSEFTESAPVLSFLKVADTVYTNGIPDVHHLELSYSRANFSGLFGTINYRAGKSQLYSTKLVGNDSDWSPPSRTPDFGYQNLRRGKYEFWVKYANDIQQWSAPFLLLTVTVLPPLWLRWWFITLVATGLFLATYFVMRKLQERKYKRIIEDLEREAALERERLRISRDLHDELGAGLSLILLNVSQSKQNLNDTSKTERCFENIAKNTKSLYDSMSNLVWLLKPENQTFESLKTRIREMAGGLFEDAGMEYTISMPENGSTQKVKREAGQHLLLIVRETINNALRHAESTNMKLSINGAETTLQITIIDNGKGFVRGNVKAGGNGLKNLEQRTKILSGNMSIYSALGEGTTVIYKFPFHAIFEN
jgi:signal transduction histidine kinase